jgi:hypothetical protein
MHVVHVGVELEANTVNGVNRVASLLIPEQRRMGCDVTVLRLAPGKPPAGAPVHPEIRSLRVAPGRPFAPSGEVREIFEQNRLTADLFHFHSGFIWAHNFAARLLSVPYVVSPHSSFMGTALRRSRLRKLAFRYALDGSFLRRLPSCMRLRATKLAR